MSEKERLKESYVRIYRERVGRAKMTGNEFLDDFLDYLKINGMKIVMEEEGKNGKS